MIIIDKLNLIKKNFFQLYILAILSLVIIFLLINTNNFIIDIFGDRDLIRSSEILQSFEVYGADFGMQYGARIPGGFNYYYLSLLLFLSENLKVINYIILFLTVVSIFFLINFNFKWLGFTGVSIFLFFFLTSGVFIYQMGKFWNPSTGFLFAILSLTFFFKFISNQSNKFYLFLSLLFIFFAAQFHVSYLVYLLPYILLTFFFKLKSLLGFCFTFLSSFTIAYFPYLLNSHYTLVNPKENDYFLISQLIDENRYLSFFYNFFFKVENKILQLSPNFTIETLLLAILLLTIFVFFFIFFKNKIFKNLISKKYYVQEILILFLALILINSKNIETEQIIFFSISIPIFVLSNYVLFKNKIGLSGINYNLKLIGSLYFIFILIILCSTIGYFFAYGNFNVVVGGSNRYSLSLIPIHSIILAFALYVLLNFAKKNEKFEKTFKFFLLLVITVKLIFFINIIEKNKNLNFKYNYNNKVSAISVLKKNYNLNKNDFYKKVSFASLDKGKFEALSKPSFQYYIDNNFEDKNSSEFKNCFLVVLDDSPSNKKKFRETIDNNLNGNKLFGYKVYILKVNFFNKFSLIEYKPFIGDCLKGILNDYVLTADEKKSLKYLLNKKSNFSFKEVISDKTNYFLKIKETNMIFPINIMIEIDQKNSDLITNIVSKRLRNSDTFLNGYWDSTIFFNSKIIFTEKSSQKKYIFKVLDGKLGHENFKTPWRIVINKPPKGYYKVNFYVETLSEKFSNIKIKNLYFLIDNNFKIE